MFALEITFDADHLVRALADARHDLEHDDKLLKSIGLSLLQANQKRHDAGQDPSGKPWTPLKPATIKHKKNPKMLVEHGDMLRFYSRAANNSVVIGTVDRKAYWHHAGTSRGLPERKLVGFERDDKVLTNEIIEDYLCLILNRVR